MLTFKHLKWKWEIVHFEKTFGTLLKRLNIHLLYDLGASQVGLVVKNLPASAGGVRDMSFIAGLGRSPGGGHSNPPSNLDWRIPWTEESGRL